MTLTPRVVDDTYLHTVASCSVLLTGKVKPTASGFEIDSTFRRNVELICNAQSDPEIALILASARNKQGVYVLGGRITNRYIDEGDTRQPNIERVLYSSIFSPGLLRISAMLTGAALVGQIPLDGDLKLFSLSVELRRQAIKELEMIIEQIADTPEGPNDSPTQVTGFYIALNVDPLSAQNSQSSGDLRPEYFTLSRSGQPVIGAKVFDALYLYPGERLTTRIFITSRGPNYGQFFDRVVTLAENTQPIYLLTNPYIPAGLNNPPAVDGDGNWIRNTARMGLLPSDIGLALATAINTLSLDSSDGGICNIMAAPRSNGQQSHAWQRSLEQFWIDDNIAQAVGRWNTVSAATVDEYLAIYNNTIAGPNASERPAYGIMRSGSVVTDMLQVCLAPRRTGGSNTSELVTIYPLQVTRAGYSAQDGSSIPERLRTVPEVLIGVDSNYTELMHNRPVSIMLGLDNKNAEPSSQKQQWDTFYFNSVVPEGQGTIRYRITSQAEPGIIYETDVFTWGQNLDNNRHAEPAAARAFMASLSTRARPASTQDIHNEDVLGAFAHPHAVQMIAWRGSVIVAPTFQVKVIVDILDLPAGLQVAVGSVEDIKPNSLWGQQASVAVDYQQKAVDIMNSKPGDEVNELIKDPDITAKAVKPRKTRSNKFQAALDRIERTEQRKNQYDLY